VKDLAGSNKDLSVLVIGGSGQVGSEIRALGEIANVFLSFPDSTEFNLTNINTIKTFLDSHSFDIILNLGAYTSVDNAEKDHKLCNEINHIAPIILAKEAKDRDLGLIHISTDYVFGKKKAGPFKTTDIRDPVNYYGKTKALGEVGVLSHYKKSIVIRLSSVFSQYGNNFVKTITRALLQKNDVKVITDQMISLTYASDFSNNILQIIELYQNLKEFENQNDRLLHFASPIYTDWFSVANIIYNEIENYTNQPLVANLIPILSNEWNSLAPRALDTRLSVDYKFLQEKNINFSSWENSVKLVVRNVLSNIEG
tara:strand:- start:11399 stop:12334 length:936 start_codon:yes stop_codon:yes gene_type:complete